jgi:septal ring factor EnvC (AmiA/AmiB activator)
MPNRKQTDLLDGMVARLEEANAKAYEQLASDERAFKSNQDDAHHPSSQQEPPAIPERRSSRGRLALTAFIGLVLAASICVAAFAYGDEGKLIIARWANALLAQPAPLPEATSHDLAPAVAPIPPELAQNMTRDLAKLEELIEQIKTSQQQMIRSVAEVTEQLKAGQEQVVRNVAEVTKQLKAGQEQIARDNAGVTEQFKASQDQMVRNNAEVVEQLKAALAQMARDNAAVAQQFRSNQEQLAMVVLSEAASFARKPSRKGKPVRLPPLQARAQSQIPR